MFQQLQLWDSLKSAVASVATFLRPPVPAAPPARAVPPAQPAPAHPAPRAKLPQRGPAAAVARCAQAKKKPRGSGSTARYDEVVRLMLAQHNIRVRKWRKSMSGIAWKVRYQDGTIVNLIESPRPKTSLSMAIFLHEIGHHAIGFDVYKPRCLEEFHAWRWSLQAMEAHSLPISDRVRYRVAASLHYAVGKAKRRGIKAVPAELTPYIAKPVIPNKNLP